MTVEGAPQDLTLMKQAVCAAASVSFEAKKGLVFEAARPINHAYFPSDRELPTATRTASGSNMHGRCSEIAMADNTECFVMMEGVDVGLHSSDLDWSVRVLASPVISMSRFYSASKCTTRAHEVQSSSSAAAAAAHLRPPSLLSEPASSSSASSSADLRDA